MINLALGRSFRTFTIAIAISTFAAIADYLSGNFITTFGIGSKLVATSSKCKSTHSV